MVLGKGGGVLSGFTDSPGKLYKSGQLSVEMDDIIGLTDTKDEIKQYIDYLNNRDKYIECGIEIPRGILFAGPPGCGKTLLAKGIAHESGVNFIFVSGSDFHEMFVGVGASRIKNLFRMARENSPCILFIDEIDSLGQKRTKNVYSSEGNSVLNKLLVEMDGFQSSDNILVIGATNRTSVLDNALLRSGRFDRKLIFDKPNINERREIFQLYLKGKKISNEINSDIVLDKLSRNTSGLTGADIKTICNQGGIICLRNNENEIRCEHLIEAIEEIMIGNVKKERLLSNDEKVRVAYHEAGHCLLGYMLNNTNPPIKVSIIPRGESALGYSQHEPSDKKLYLKCELYSRVVVLLGGRAAEEIEFESISTGASDDLEKATELCYNIVTKYGFTKTLVSYNLDKHYISDTRKEIIDKQIDTIMNEMYGCAKIFIKNNYTSFQKIAERLLKDEEILGEDIEKIIGMHNKNSLEIFK